MVAWTTRRREYRDSGSFFLTRRMRQSYAFVFDIRIISTVRLPVENLRSNPPTSFYGYATIFEGDVPTLRIPIDFAHQRIVSLRNSEAARNYNDVAFAKYTGAYVTDIGEAADVLFQAANPLQLAPLLEHRETTIKFKANPLTQFEFFAAWLEFDPLDPNTPDFNESAPSAQGDQYYAPRINPTDDPWNGNNLPDEPDTRLDDRDFSDENDPDTGITGTLNYQFRDQASGPFANASIPNINWPGSFVCGQFGGFDAVFWEDSEGTQTLMVNGASPPVEVQLVNLVTDEGQTFIPDPASFSCP